MMPQIGKPTRCFVVNEWVLYDLGGRNGRDPRIETFTFLERMFSRCDHLAVLRGSPWEDKAYQLMKSTDRETRQLSQYLRVNILLNSRTCRILQPTEVTPLSIGLAEAIPNDDRYLLQTYLAANADVFITKDERLLEILSRVEGMTINGQHRDTFLKEYLSLP